MKNILLLFLCLFMMSCTKSGSNVKTSVPQDETGIYQQQEEIGTYQQQEERVTDAETESSTSFPDEGFFKSGFSTLSLISEKGFWWSLTFRRDNTYRFHLAVDGDQPSVEGSYQILDNKVLLKYKETTHEPDYYAIEDIIKEDWELEYTVINDSLYYSEGLTGKGIIFGRNGSSPGNGEIRTVNGHEIVIQRIDRVEPKSDVTVRIGPGTNFQHCVFQWPDYDSEFKYLGTFTTEFFRGGWAPIEIIGHSKNTDTVNGLTGYWYYCWVPVYPDMGGEIIKPSGIIRNSAWFFGPDIGLK